MTTNHTELCEMLRSFSLRISRMSEAADLIESQAARIQQLKGYCISLELKCDKNLARIEKLQQALAEWRADFKAQADRIAELEKERDALKADAERLNAIINTPQSGDFLRAVSIEAEHQRQRWGSSHDAGKAPADWFWLVGYLGGKALHAHAAGNIEKAEHHIITTAAACENWHKNMFSKTDMRPGIDGEAALQAEKETRS